MKFTKTLASVCAAAIAVSSLAVSAFAGSITFSDKVWWTQKDLKIEDVLEATSPKMSNQSHSQATLLHHRLQLNKSN